MKIHNASVSGPTPALFGLTFRDGAFCAMPVIALGVSILTLL